MLLGSLNRSIGISFDHMGKECDIISLDSSPQQPNLNIQTLVAEFTAQLILLGNSPRYYSHAAERKPLPGFAGGPMDRGMVSCVLHCIKH